MTTNGVDSGVGDVEGDEVDEEDDDRGGKARGTLRKFECEFEGMYTGRLYRNRTALQDFSQSAVSFDSRVGHDSRCPASEISNSSKRPFSFSLNLFTFRSNRPI